MKNTKQERISIVTEEYLLIIYSLLLDQQTVKAVMLANRLENSPSTVHATLSRLEKNSLVYITNRKEIKLTPKGLEKAEKLTRRHRLVEKFLCDVLGISWHEVHKHACKLEHGLTPLVEEKLASFLNFPEFCPHGTPMPGSDNKLPDNMLYLDQSEVGDTIEIVIVSESMENSLELMKFLQDKNIVPGKRHKITERLEATQTLVLKSDGDNATLPFNIANKIGVIKVD